MRPNDIQDNDIPSADPEAVIIQYEPLVRKIAGKYTKILSMTGAVDFEDLHQAGRIAVSNAQKTYNPEPGCSFMTYVYDRIRSAMRNTIGFNCKGILPRDITDTFYIDAPLPGTEDYSLIETIPDNHPTREEELAEEDRKSEIRDAVRGAVDRLSSVRQREAITRVYFDGLNQVEAGGEMGITGSAVSALEKAALRKMRHDEKLQQFAMPYFSVGLAKFNTTWTSAVEAVVLWREEHQKKPLSDEEKMILAEKREIAMMKAYITRIEKKYRTQDPDEVQTSTQM